MGNTATIPRNTHASVYVTLLIPPPNGEGYVFISVRLFVCLSVSLQHYGKKSDWRIFMKFLAKVGFGTRNNLENLGVLSLTLWIHGFFSYVYMEIRVC